MQKENNSLSFGGEDMEMAFMSWDSLGSSVFGTGGRTDKVETEVKEKDQKKKNEGQGQQRERGRGGRGSRGQNDRGRGGRGRGGYSGGQNDADDNDFQFGHHGNRDRGGRGGRGQGQNRDRGRGQNNWGQGPGWQDDWVIGQHNENSMNFQSRRGQHSSRGREFSRGRGQFVDRGRGGFRGGFNPGENQGLKRKQSYGEGDGGMQWQMNKFQALAGYKPGGENNGDDTDQYVPDDGPGSWTRIAEMNSVVDDGGGGGFNNSWQRRNLDSGGWNRGSQNQRGRGHRGGNKGQKWGQNRDRGDGEQKRWGQWQRKKDSSVKDEADDVEYVSDDGPGSWAQLAMMTAAEGSGGVKSVALPQGSKNISKNSQNSRNKDSLIQKGGGSEGQQKNFGQNQQKRLDQQQGDSQGRRQAGQGQGPKNKWDQQQKGQGQRKDGSGKQKEGQMLEHFVGQQWGPDQQDLIQQDLTKGQGQVWGQNQDQGGWNQMGNDQNQWSAYQQSGWMGSSTVQSQQGYEFPQMGWSGASGMQPNQRMNMTMNPNISDTRGPGVAVGGAQGGNGWGMQQSACDWQTMGTGNNTMVTPGIPGQPVINKISSAEGQGYVNAAKMSMTEQIEMLKSFLQKGNQRVNAILTLDNAMHNNYIQMKKEYTDMEVTPKAQGRTLYTGRLSINGHYIARTVATNKRELKHEVYKMALEKLTSTSTEEILADRDPGAGSMRAEYHRKMNELRNTKPEDHGAQEGFVSEENFQRLMHYMKKKVTVNNGDNVVSVFEKGVINSRSFLCAQFTSEDQISICGRRVYKGYLSLNNVLIARGKAYQKKVAKLDTYAEAIKALQTKSLAELLQPPPDLPEKETEFLDLVPTDEEEDPNPEAIIGMGKFNKQRTLEPLYMKPNMKCSPLLTRLGGLVSCVTQSTTPTEDNLEDVLDEIAVELGLNPNIIIRRTDIAAKAKVFRCEVYIDNIFMAKADGKRDANLKLEAYKETWKLLSTSTAEDIYKKQPRLDVIAAADISAYYSLTQGFGSEKENNTGSLRRFRRDPYKLDSTLDKLVIMEYQCWSDNRLANARRILHLSATISGLVVHWKSNPASLLSDCTTSMQSVTLASAVHPSSKAMARRMSSALALFKLYKDHSVIQIRQRIDSQYWIAWSNIQEEGMQLKKAAGPQGTDKSDEHFRLQVIKNLIENFAKRNSYDELIFGPGAMAHEMKEWREIARSNHLNAEVRLHGNTQYLVVLPIVSLQHLLQVLQNSPRKSVGIYKLVFNAELPSQDDLDKYLQELSENMDLSSS